MVWTPGWNVIPVLLYIRHWFFKCFVKKKRLLSHISNTKKETKKKENNSSCSFYKTIKCNNNVNDSNKNVTNFF